MKYKTEISYCQAETAFLYLENSEEAAIRPNCIDALQKLVGKIKNDLVVEKEIYA